MGKRRMSCNDSADHLLSSWSSQAFFMNVNRSTIASNYAGALARSNAYEWPCPRRSLSPRCLIQPPLPVTRLLNLPPRLPPYRPARPLSFYLQRQDLSLAVISPLLPERSANAIRDKLRSDSFKRRAHSWAQTLPTPPSSSTTTRQARHISQYGQQITMFCCGRKDRCSCLSLSSR